MVTVRGCYAGRTQLTSPPPKPVPLSDSSQFVMAGAVAVDDPVFWQYFVFRGMRISLEIAATLRRTATHKATCFVELTEIGSQRFDQI
jgi:hypothetical protein